MLSKPSFTAEVNWKLSNALTKVHIQINQHKFLQKKLVYFPKDVIFMFTWSNIYTYFSAGAGNIP